jgi:acyl-CoA hydrolase
VVTEYGAVDLRPLPLADRAAALVELAHPRHRAALTLAGEAAA